MSSQNPEPPGDAEIIPIYEQSRPSSPIPDPRILAEYREIAPESVGIILENAKNEANHRRTMEEKEQDHRIQIEQKIVNSDIRLAYLGLSAAFIIAISGLGGSVYLGIKDKAWASGILGAGTLTGLVTVFINGKEVRGKQKGNKTD